MSITIDSVPAIELDAGQIALWRDIQRSDSRLQGPYFCPEFTLAVAAVRDDVRVAVFRAAGQPAGFFPYQAHRFGIARPVGSFLSDFHGAIVKPDADWSWSQLVRSCNLRGFEFHHLIDTRLPWLNCSARACSSPYIDLSAGFDDYLKKRQANTREITQTLRKARKVEKEAGPVRFVYRATDPAAWKTLIEWKTDQYQRTNALDAFASVWSRRLLEELSETRGPVFNGVLSTLYFGDRLAAVHFGIQAGRILHWWFPAYDSNLSKYSPGLILLLETAKAASQEGITRIDLGKGTERYKTSFMSGAGMVYEGAIDRNAMLHRIRKNTAGLRRWALATPAGPIARKVVNSLRKSRTHR